MRISLLLKQKCNIHMRIIRFRNLFVSRFSRKCNILMRKHHVREGPQKPVLAREREARYNKENFLTAAKHLRS